MALTQVAAPRPTTASTPSAAGPTNVALFGVAAMVTMSSVMALAVHLAGGSAASQLVVSTAAAALAGATATYYAIRRYGFDRSLWVWRRGDLLTGATSAVLAAAAAFAAIAFARAAGIPLNDPSSWWAGGSAAVALTLLRLCIAPVVEEALFRGVLLRSLVDLLGQRSAVVVQAAIFGIAHVRVFGGASGGRVVAAFAAGVVLGIVTLRTQRLAPAVVAHVIINAI